MVEAMLDGVADVANGPWQKRITELAHRLRRALLSRRDDARIFSGTFFPSPTRWPTARR
jgi:tetracycline repressor-like protein